MERFIKDQLSAGKQNYNEDTFFEAVSEVSVLYFYTFRSRWKQALYEPPIGKSKLSKNPEARFIGELSLNGDAQKITINIEVNVPSSHRSRIKNAKLRYLPFCFLMKVEKKFQHSARIMGLSI